MNKKQKKNEKKSSEKNKNLTLRNIQKSTAIFNFSFSYDFPPFFLVLFF